MEEEIFGFPVTRHPLELLTAGPADGLVAAGRMALFAGRRVRMRGLAISSKRIPVRKGRGWMKFLSLEDLTGTFEATLFPAVYARYAEATLGPGPYLLEGRVELDHGVPALTVEHLEPLASPGPAAAGPRSACRRDRAGV
jgi:DNA polymerase III alpha subunit